MFAIARSVTGDEELAMLYAGLIRNLVRDENGYIAPIPQTVRVPNADTPIDIVYFEYYFSDFEWGICGGETVEAPCLYQIPDDFVIQTLEQNYQAIAYALFPSLGNAIKCIKDANTYVHRGVMVIPPWRSSQESF